MILARIISAMGWMVLSVFMVPDGIGGIRVQIEKDSLQKELPMILRAAERNGCYDDDFLILLAIRKAENGGSGREFGILHPKALALIKAAPERGLEIQAAWAAATIVKNRRRWLRQGNRGEFIDYLGNKYCPAQTDPEGNINWKKNVRYWFEQFKNA